MTYSPTTHTARRSRQEPPEKVDVAIVGCGPGGLVAGAYLAQAGFEVACFDSHYVAGGNMTMFRRKTSAGPAHFDVGLHYVGEPDGAIARLMAGVGRPVDMVPMDGDGFDQLHLPDFTFKVPADRAQYQDRLTAQFPKERKGIAKYVKLLEQLAKVSHTNNKVHGKLGLRLALAGLRAPLVTRNMTRTIGAFLDENVRDPQVKAIMLGQHGDYGLPPSKVASLLHAGLANHYFEGPWYPKGGGQTMSDNLAEVIEAAGGSVHLRRPVERIIVEDGRAVGLALEPRHNKAHVVRADTVISNADLKRTLLELVGPEHLPSEWVTKANGWEWPVSLFMTCLVVEGDLRTLGAGAHNVWQFDEYDVDQIYAKVHRGEGPIGAYITSGSLKDPGTDHHAPPGHQTLEVMTLASGDPRHWGVDVGLTDIEQWRYRKSAEYLDKKAQWEAALIDRAERVFPGVKSRIIYKESATPLTQGRFTRATRGTCYGIASTPAQFMQRRPHFRGPVEGLVHCGASLRTGHGIIGAMMSGYMAARIVARGKDRTLPEIW